MKEDNEELAAKVGANAEKAPKENGAQGRKADAVSEPDADRKTERKPKDRDVKETRVSGAKRPRQDKDGPAPGRKVARKAALRNEAADTAMDAMPSTSIRTRERSPAKAPMSSTRFSRPCFRFIVGSGFRVNGVGSAK